MTFLKDMVVSTLTGMGTRPNRRSPTRRRERRLPEYARKIRDLRKECDLTQPQLAAELQTRRGAVARWEGATREPNEQNYARLRDLARRRNLESYERFFFSQILAKIRDREDRFDEADASRFFQIILENLGAEDLKRLIESSKMDYRVYIRQQVKRVVEAHKTLSNGEMMEAFTKVAFETFVVKQLSKPGGLEAFRRIRRVERDLEHLREIRKGEPAEVTESQRRTIKQIIQGWTISVLQGKVPDRDEFEKNLAQSNLLGATLARVSGIVAEKLAADKEGRPYSDGQFIDDLGQVLGTEGQTNGLGNKREKGES